jgi:hypothetical protein
MIDNVSGLEPTQVQTRLELNGRPTPGLMHSRFRRCCTRS